ncbi:MAG: hypothetical protein AABX64_02790 [Nanoarchaeota archaeon]
MLIKVTPDKEKAASILRMADTTLQMIPTIDAEKFTSNVIKEYYEVIRELTTIIVLLDGYKTQGEMAHKELLEYLSSHHKDFSEQEVRFMEELRITRNKIAYDGFFVPFSYFQRNKSLLLKIITALKKKINGRLK